MKTERLVILIEPERLRALREIAVREHVSLATVVRRFLDKGLKASERMSLKTNLAISAGEPEEKS